MKNFIEGYVNALTSEECKTIIDYMNEEVELEPGKVKEPNTGEDIVSKGMKDSLDVQMNLLEDETWNGSMDNYISEETSFVNRTILASLSKCISLYTKKHPQMNNIDFWQVDPYYNLQKYEPGQAFHETHCENASKVTSHRVLAWMYYLNTIKDGGGTQFDNYEIAVDAVEGRCLIWPAYWTHFHHGIVSKTETKYIATGWFLYS